MKPSTLICQPNTASKSLFIFLVCISFTLALQAQYNVTEVISDYNGYWKTSADAVNAVKPDNSHNLLSFSFKGKRYSTGVNDALLTAKGQTYIAGDYRALPVNSVGSTVTSNTKIGLGAAYDGVANGAGTVPPINNIPYYLTDGIKGLDLGTGVANLPAGTLVFALSGIQPAAVNDGVPDMLITQIGDPSGSLDRYEFMDINGARVGNYVDVQLSDISPVGNWTADFYEASTNPMKLTSGFTKTDRPLRLWASDLSAFGITASNVSKIAYFKINLSGNSDVAFVAYNNSAINMINALLPVKLNSFSAKETNGQVQLSWQTAAEINSNEFVIEKSTDGTTFNAIETVKAAGQPQTYAALDIHAMSGKAYYRLKMIDKDSHADYSQVIALNISGSAGAISLYPNPAKDYINVNHPFAGNNEQLRVINMQGVVLMQNKIVAGSFQTRVQLRNLTNGIYELVWTNGKDVVTNRLSVQ